MKCPKSPGLLLWRLETAHSRCRRPVSLDGLVDVAACHQVGRFNMATTWKANSLPWGHHVYRGNKVLAILVVWNFSWGNFLKSWGQLCKNTKNIRSWDPSSNDSSRNFWVCIKTNTVYRNIVVVIISGNAIQNHFDIIIDPKRNTKAPWQNLKEDYV